MTTAVGRAGARSAGMSITIRPASPDDIDEAVAIDDDACTLYERAGLHVDLGPEHPYTRAERARWTLAAEEGRAFLALASDGRAVGLLVLGLVDGEPYLDQLSVRSAAMRRGIGRLLLERAITWAAGAPLWLTTYSHVPWNRPFYEREGFVVVPEAGCPRGILEELQEQRRCLPAPGERVAMRRAPRPGESTPSA
jgi:GNAT superfamily N-acetyltransferase